MVNTLSNKIDRYRFWWHIMFWVAYIISATIVYGSDESNYKNWFIFIVYQAPVTIMATYVLLYWQLPKLLFRKKYISFIFSFVLTALLFSSLQRTVIYFGIFPKYFPEKLDTPVITIFRLLYSTLQIYYVSAVAATIKLIKQWYKNQQATQNLQKEKLEAELKFLKSQIHPHFLFNTLNNLYALTLKKSDNAPEVVLKLSDLLNYMLYECNVPKVSLEKEIQLIENYISLERIRYNEKLEVDLTKEGNFKGKRIAPMLLIPLIENSFKHGLSKELDSPWLLINIKSKGIIVDFEIRNAKDPDKQKENTSYTAGIGLANVKRRLELIYPEKHKLEIKENPNEFIVKLTLHLID